MAFIITYAGSNGLFEEVTKIIKGEKREAKSPPTPEVIPPSPSSTDSPPKSEKGDSNSLYFSPAKEGKIGEYMDLSKTLNSDIHKRLRKENNGLSPITLYKDPSGNNQGITFGKITDKNGKRNIYEANQEFTDNWLTKWSYTGKNKPVFKQSAIINKNWLPIMNQMAQFLESENLWNAKAIKSWDCGILRRDVHPNSGIQYGHISSHAYGMAVDINAEIYPLGHMKKYETDLKNGKLTAKVIDKLNNKFKGKIFWAGPSGDPHHFSVKISA